MDARLFLNLNGFNDLSVDKKIEQLKGVARDRRSPRDIEKVKQYREKLKALQPN